MRSAVKWLSGALGALIFALYLLYPLTGDDYSYMGTFRTVDGFDGPWGLAQLYRWFPFHWLHVNGRFANLFAMLSLTFLPKWLTATIMGVATWGMLSLMLRLGDAWGRRGLAASAALAYVAAAYPWWDLMYSVDFNFNYPVATCAGLLYVYLWQRYKRFGSGWKQAVCLLACFIAGGFHESMGAPLLAASLWLLLFDRVLSKAPVAAFGAGVAVAFSSPGIWGRATAERVADAPLPELLLLSAPLTLAAVALFAMLLVSKRWREWLKDASRGWWGFWMVASLGSLAFCAAGGIVGRSGWFSQSFALVALLLWGKGLSAPKRLATTLSTVFCAAALFFTAAPIPYVVEMARQEAAAREQLRVSTDGVVSADIPLESAQPWWTLRRVRALDADDYYLHQIIADYYKKPRFLILPPEGLPETDRLPSGAVPIEPGTYNAPAPERFLHTTPDGHQTVYLLNPSTGRYLLTPRILDPGDR